jgi:peptidoglycan hydrolase-like protein with peptidoglycan-binding domain
MSGLKVLGPALLMVSVAACGMLGQQVATQSTPPAMWNNLSYVEVWQLQEALDEQGFDAGPVNGVLGPRTRTAVQKFQRSKGLPASGEPDHQTLANLGISAQTF